MNIAFTGWAGSGKTEAAKYISIKYGLKKISFADGIKDIAFNIFGAKEKSRDLLQQIGEKLREIDPDVWVKHTIRRMSFLQDGFVIDDLRRKNEFDALIKNNFYIFRIVADEETRIKRLINRDGHCDRNLLYNESENGCSDIEMLSIDNNGGLADLYKQLDKVMQKIYFRENII